MFVISVKDRVSTSQKNFYVFFTTTKQVFQFNCIIKTYTEKYCKRKAVDTTTGKFDSVFLSCFHG